ncbi:hypothetical protein EI94DRAFT_1736357 [Lactarius quietus]|nr:hypothetical protein EI94DRAFT_1736357 [Lactarius quietus]
MVGDSSQHAMCQTCQWCQWVLLGISPSSNGISAPIRVGDVSMSPLTTFPTSPSRFTPVCVRGDERHGHCVLPRDLLNTKSAGRSSARLKSAHPPLGNTHGFRHMPYPFARAQRPPSEGTRPTRSMAVREIKSTFPYKRTLRVSLLREPSFFAHTCSSFTIYRKSMLICKAAIP